MYSTCIHCHAPLGRNDILERFPVGRRLAIDGEKGRLWVVCQVCRQWNLSPIDERWEAIEDAERLYRGTHLRTSTDNIGLAKLADGSELIRIGKAPRPEFAAWRYGARFTKRWLINAPGAAVASVLGVVGKVGGARLLFSVGAIPAAIVLGIATASIVVSRSRVVSRITLDGGERIPLTNSHIIRMRIITDEDEPLGWYLRLKHPPASRSHGWGAESDPEAIVRGAEAVRVASQLLPRLNRTGGHRGSVAEAVKILDRASDQNYVFRLAGRFDSASKSRRFGRYADEVAEETREPDTTSALAGAPVSIRLALEMAAHEEQERRALEGELAEIEKQWREAEEIAAIADSLVLPPSVLAQMERFRLR